MVSSIRTAKTVPDGCGAGDGGWLLSGGFIGHEAALCSIDQQFQQEPGGPENVREYLFGPARVVGFGVVGGVLATDRGAPGRPVGGDIVGCRAALPEAVGLAVAGNVGLTAGVGVLTGVGAG